MFEVTVNTRRAVVGTKELITTSSAGIQVQFTFSEDWDELSKIAIFRNGDEGQEVAVALPNSNLTVIPAQSCSEDFVDEPLFVGVYGTDGLGAVIIPTVWTSLGVLRPGAVTTDIITPPEPTPDMWAQILAIANEAAAIADECEANEELRVAAEQLRAGAETARANAEALRAAAEDARAENENQRQGAETQRQAAEDARAQAEALRIQAEELRQTNETSRVSAESDRASAEQTRQTNEATRASNEAARVTAEQNRASAETQRTSAESSRVTEETSRVSAESSRATAEQDRASAETARASAESQRVTAENNRVSAEQNRVNAEDERVQAETDRATEFATWENTIASKVPNTRTVNGKALSTDITLDAGDIGYDGTATYQNGTAGAALSELNRQLSDVEENQIPELKNALSSLSDDLDDVESDVSDCFVYLNKIAVEEPGKNLDNPATDTNNCWIGYSGEVATLTEYSISDFIEVEVGKTYAFGGYRNFSPYALIKTRTLCAYYDANKAYISGSRQNVDNTSGLVITIPSGVKYIRISSHTVGGYLMIVESSTVPENYIPYVTEMVVKAKVPELEELSPLIGTTEYKAIRNWYNPDTSEEGFLQYAGNIDSSPTGTIYSTSALIPVKPNTNYYISLYNPLFQSVSLRIIAAGYDENGVFQPSSYVNQDRVSNIIYNSGNNAFIKVCARAEREGNHLMVTEDPDSTVFFEYDGKTYFSLSVDSSNVPEYPTLYGKKWAVCGDSFTYSGGTGTLISDGIYKGRPFTYPWIIGGRNNMEIAKFFDGGKTLAFPASPGDFDNSLTNPSASYYYQNIPSDVDYITIYLGINDEHHATGGGDGEDPTGVIPLGTIDDNTTATYFGAWNVVLTWLITNRPNAHIGIIVTNGLSIEAYRNAQISIARKYGIPFIDLNGDDRTPAMLRTVNPNIPTAIKQALIAKWAVDPTGAGGTVNTHPNDAAQLFESAFIENFLRSL